MTSSRQNIIRDFNKAAKTYDEYANFQRIVADKLFQNASCYFDNSNDHILDIGSGTGYFHELLRKNKLYNPLTQLDIAENMCKIAATYASTPKYGRTVTCTADMNQLPFPEQTFDIAFSSMALQWAPDLQIVLKNINKILKKNGYFIFNIVAEDSLHELSKAFLDIKQKPPIYKFTNKENLQMQLTNLNFKIKTINLDSITMFYKDIYSLLYTIKGVGGSYKNNNKSGLKGKNHFLSLEQKYRENFSNKSEIPLSWNIISAIVTK